MSLFTGAGRHSLLDHGQPGADEQSPPIGYLAPDVVISGGDIDRFGQSSILADASTLQTLAPWRSRSSTAQTPDTYSAPSHFNVWPIGHDKTSYPDYRGRHGPVSESG